MPPRSPPAVEAKEKKKKKEADAGRPNGTTTSTHPEDVQRQLRLKRAEIDAEIAAFRRRKEAEYVAFEQDVVAKAVGAPRTAGNGTATTLPPAPPAIPNDGTTEEELRTLFNLSYLPLLEGAQSAAAGGSGSTTKSDKTKVSSSFTLPSTTYRPPTPPTTASQASSAPRPSLGHHHRSSSRSDTSPSLRSSLKGTSAKSEEPGRSPKAAKHVLFHIDGGVIAPSSSPVVERKVEGLPKADITANKGLQSTSKPLESGPSHSSTTTTGVASSSAGSAGVSPSPASQSTLPPNLSSNPSLGAPTSPSPSSGKAPGMSQSYALLDTSTPTPVEAGVAEEFDLAGGADPLFDLDDEGPPSIPDDELEPDDPHAHHPAAMEKGGRAVASPAKEPTSPHAGSVPIEIKWPGRK